MIQQQQAVTRLESGGFVVDLRPEFGDIAIWSQHSKERVVIKESELGELIGMLDRAATHYLPKVYKTACPNCGERVRYDSTGVYCDECGLFTIPGGLACPTCRAIMRYEHSGAIEGIYCDECGYKDVVEVVAATPEELLQMESETW